MARAGGSWAGVWIALGLAGCGDVRVDGTVNGQAVGGARSAIFGDIDFDVPFLGSIEFTSVILSDVPDACEVFTELIDAEAAADDCPAVCASFVQIADDHGLDPVEYWTLNLTVNTNDGAVGGFSFADLADETDEFTASFARVDGAQIADLARCESACEDGGLLLSEDEVPDAGSLELAALEGEELPGELTLEFGGTDTLEASFEADPCDLEAMFE